MKKLRGRSKVPMILGLIGGLIGIPCTLLSFKMTQAAGAEIAAAVQIYLYFAFVGCAIGLVFSFLAKRKPLLAGTMQLVAAACVGLSVIGSLVLNVPTFLLFLIGAVVTFAQEREVYQ